MSKERDCDLEQLEQLLAGQLEADPDGILMFPQSGMATDPLTWAAQARRILGDRVRIYGFWCFENPQATLMGELRERHDFAVIDQRWIIDLWMRRYYSDEDVGMVDLNNAEAYEAARPIYGDPATWERDLDMEIRMDHQPALSKAAIPAGIIGDLEVTADF